MKLNLADLKISTRLWMMLGIGSVAIAAAILWFVADKRAAVMQEKRDATRHVVEAAVGALDRLEAAVTTGTVSRDAAQRMAIIAIKGMRYEGEEYLWINDMAPAMVMHPTKPELDGKDLAGFKDPNGKALFVAMVEAVRARGGGFVDYMWPKPGATTPQPKISYVKGFAPWGWVVGSGIYVDDVEAAFWQGIRLTAMGIVVGGFGYFVMVLLLVRGINRPLAEAVDFAQSVAGGDLTRCIESRSGDEIGQLLAALRRMSDRLNTMLMSIQGTAQSVATASAQIASGNADLAKRTEAQAASLEETAASMAQLTTTVQQNADNARQANQLAASASEIARHGGGVVREVVTTMQSISASSKRIADIIGVIDGIAFQTNILALNAAVEAARAGEQGRGFAVVASEVRALAQRSAGAAKEIKNLISTSVGEISAGATLVSDAGRTIDEVVAAVKRVTDIMTEITAASREQSAGIGQVAQAVTQMDEATQQNAALVEESAAAAASMEQQAQQLASAVAVFKVAGSNVSAPVGQIARAAMPNAARRIVGPTSRAPDRAKRGIGDGGVAFAAGTH